MIERLRRMIENFNDKPLEEVTKHLDRLVTSTAFVAGAAAVAKYSDKVLPACPSAAKLIGIVLVFAGWFLIVWVGLGAWVGIAKLEPSRLRSHLTGILLFLVSILVGVGDIFAALSA